MLSESEAESLLVGQLRALAGAHGEPNEFSVAVEGVRVSVSYSPGSGSNLVLSAPYPAGGGALAAPIAPVLSAGYREQAARRLRAHRPMSIELRREIASDRQAKAEGINREVQTGDAAFDAAVYIDTPTPDEVVAAVLGSPALRQGVTTLLELGFSRVVIDDAREEIRAPIHVFAQKDEHLDRAARALSAFAAIVRDAPHIERIEGPRPRDPWDAPLRLMTLATLAALGVGAPALYFSMTPGRCVEHVDDGYTIRGEWACWAPLAVGLPLGLLLGVFLGRLASALTRSHYVGRSDSSQRMGGPGCLGLMLGMLLALVGSVLWFYQGG